MIDLSKYGPEDFSPIHGRYAEKPEHAGYYITEHIAMYDAFEEYHRTASEPNEAACRMLHYWNGSDWYASHTDSAPFMFQDFAWFGLKEKPNG